MSAKRFPTSEGGWSFALINGRLAEIFFNKGFNIWGHRYRKDNKFNAWEKKMMRLDLQRCRFTFRNNYYIDRQLGTRQKQVKFSR